MIARTHYGVINQLDFFLQPTIFYDHFYDFGIHDVMTELIEARRRARIHCGSSIKIYTKQMENEDAEE